MHSSQVITLPDGGFHCRRHPTGNDVISITAPKRYRRGQLWYRSYLCWTVPGGQPLCCGSHRRLAGNGLITAHACLVTATFTKPSSLSVKPSKVTQRTGRAKSAYCLHRRFQSQDWLEHQPSTGAGHADQVEQYEPRPLLYASGDHWMASWIICRSRHQNNWLVTVMSCQAIKSLLQQLN